MVPDGEGCRRVPCGRRRVRRNEGGAEESDQHVKKKRPARSLPPCSPRTPHGAPGDLRAASGHGPPTGLYTLSSGATNPLTLEKVEILRMRPSTTSQRRKRYV